MKTLSITYCCAALAAIAVSAQAEELSLEQAPPVVLKTSPVAGATDVDPATSEIKVTYSKVMQDGSWSWSTWGEENFPATTGKPHYDTDAKTCVLPVKLVPGKFYAIWLNSDKFHNFKDAEGRSAVPYLLTFRTTGEPLGSGGGGGGGAAGGFGGQSSVAGQPPAGGGGGGGGFGGQTSSADPAFLSLLTEDQRKVLAWTDRQFRGFFDSRTFEGLTAEERAGLETKTIDALKGPHSRDYYQAINTLGALKSAAAVKPLLEIAAERREKDNRDRWMAIRALGLIGDKSVVPELIHLTYHGNVNTRWWAQLSLVRLTGVNFGKDWRGWGKWWNEQGGNPPFNPEFVKWYSAPEWSEPEAAARSVEEFDSQFLKKL